MRIATTILLSAIFSTSLWAQQTQTGGQTAPAQQPRREVKWVNPEIAKLPGITHHLLQSNNLGFEVGYVVWTPPE